ncbi:Thioredoxin domain-containing protein 5 [Dictyocoela roeselum]|nr:Thioredoxin domain-containing protein 5 [Dictyocoela roeselum]
MIGFIKFILMKSCPIDMDRGISLTKYYKEDCPHCAKITPFIEEIKDKVDFIRFNDVNCNDCDCKELNIKAVPTLILRKDGQEIDRFRGYNDFHQIIMFLRQVGVTPDMIEKPKMANGVVKELYERDFYKAFEGPWLILFYSKKNDKVRDLMKEAAIKYRGKVNFGEINKTSSVNIVPRFNISVFPTILAMFNGIVSGYSGKPDIFLFSEFIDQLIAPSFKEIDLDEFTKITKETKDPIFIVFTNDLLLANSYFKRAAHEYKLHTRMYKTTDPALFDRANIHPNDGKDEERVILAVYKNGAFHQFPEAITSENIAVWIYNTHFPHLTRITNQNFYTVFHGIKPAVILISQNEEHVADFEQVAKKMSLGLPYTEQIFCTLDANEYSLFIPQLLPGLKPPLITIFNPRKQLFYYKPFNFKKNLDFQISDLIKMYTSGSIKPYPPKFSYKKYLMYGLLAFLLLVIVAIILKREKRPMD